MHRNPFATLVDAFDDAAGPALTAPLSTTTRILSPDTFDYGATGLNAEDVSVIQAHRSRIVLSLTTAVIQAGQDLLTIKSIIEARCPRGTWTRWLRSALPVSESTARNYMAAAECARISPPVGELAPSALFKLAAAPERARARIVDRLNEGETITARDIEESVRIDRQLSQDRQIEMSPASEAHLTCRDEADPTERAAQDIIEMLLGRYELSEVEALVALLGQTTHERLSTALATSRRLRSSVA